MSDLTFLRTRPRAPVTKPASVPESAALVGPKISVLIYTARGDRPYANREWHCFDPVVKTLAAQTLPPDQFELVLVDMHYETRADYFTKHPQLFAVKHVPSSPNRWQARRRPGLCEQINRGFAWADGELVWMGGENNLFPPTHLERAWQIYQGGAFPVAWYAICGNRGSDGGLASRSDGSAVGSGHRGGSDGGLANRSDGSAEVEPGSTDDRSGHRDCPADFDLLGYTREHVVEMDHRGKRFADRHDLQTWPCPYQNYFGYSGVSTAAAIAVNGFDELFDGQWCLFDCDFGSRLDLAGHKMVMARDFFVVEPPVMPTGTRDVYDGIELQETFKCHYAIYLHNRATRRRANSPLGPNYASNVKATACYNLCNLKEQCKAGQAHAASPSPPGGTPADGGPSRYIDESKYYPFCEGKHRDRAAQWLAEARVRDLAADREDRRAGRPPFDRATIHNP